MQADRSSSEATVSQPRRELGCLELPEVLFWIENLVCAMEKYMFSATDMKHVNTDGILPNLKPTTLVKPTSTSWQYGIDYMVLVPRTELPLKLSLRCTDPQPPCLHELAAGL